MFLYNGRYFTLSQRLTRKVIAHVDPNEGRTVSFEYLNQQLVWGELQHFVMFLLPLLTPGSLAANNFLASATAKLMRFCNAPGMHSTTFNSIGRSCRCHVLLTGCYTAQQLRVQVTD